MSAPADRPPVGPGPTLRLHADASAASVAMLRVGVFLLCAAEAWLLLQQAAAIPDGAWTPFGVLEILPDSLLDGLRSAAGQRVLFVSAMITALLAALAVAPAVTLPLATVLFIVSQAVPRALQGLVNHAQVPVMLAAVVLTLGPSADALVAWPRKRRAAASARDYQSTLVLIVAAICVGYSFIAAHRIAYGGLSLFTDDSLLQWLVQRNLSSTDPEQALGVQLVRSPQLATLVRFGFPIVTLLELLAPLCLFSRRFRLFFIPAMLCTHLAIFLLMRLSFSQLAVLYVVFIDSAAWSPRRPALDAEGQPQPLTVFFDGVCGLCNKFVDYLLSRDKGQTLRFAPLQGSTAAEFPQLPRDIDAVVAAEPGRVLAGSDAALAAISRLGGLWVFVAVLGLVPRPLRETIYAWVARNRYRWFGQRDSCRLPTPEKSRWFLP